MRFNLKEILHVPGASLPFESQLDLSDLDFYGERPFAHPVVIHGTVRNMADALLLKGSADTTMELVCDRCLKPFQQELHLPVSTLLAETLEDEENDEGDDGRSAPPRGSRIDFGQLQFGRDYEIK